MFERVLGAEEMALRPLLADRRHGLLEIVEWQPAGVFVPADKLFAVGGEF